MKIDKFCFFSSPFLSPYQTLIDTKEALFFVFLTWIRPKNLTLNRAFSSNFGPAERTEPVSLNFDNTLPNWNCWKMNEPIVLLPSSRLQEEEKLQIHRFFTPTNQRKNEVLLSKVFQEIINRGSAKNNYITLEKGRGPVCRGFAKFWLICHCLQRSSHRHIGSSSHHY